MNRRPSATDGHNLNRRSSLHQAGEHTSAELAELFGVARSTVYRAVERAAGSKGA
ncbi:helix-turn-helix domain-containing protein [Microbispora sp. ATCC PTA-5024]|uniref:helix-turn-helix domain-containing protein n=1 Tax=Microbispora sp. ATCC PTA-5024 TaxID=316330 RepID=UPI001E503C95|nr:helix-turn-helix domain-containing protein [Microbispora sp. ATCC PTA-5024]